MNTTHVGIKTACKPMIDRLVANGLSIRKVENEYVTCVSVAVEARLSDAIFMAAEETEATATVSFYYQDGSGLDTRTYEYHFENGRIA